MMLLNYSRVKSFVIKDVRFIYIIANGVYYERPPSEIENINLSIINCTLACRLTECCSLLSVSVCVTLTGQGEDRLCPRPNGTDGMLCIVVDIHECKVLYNKASILPAALHSGLLNLDWTQSTLCQQQSMCRNTEAIVNTLWEGDAHGLKALLLFM